MRAMASHSFDTAALVGIAGKIFAAHPALGMRKQCRAADPQRRCEEHLRLATRLVAFERHAGRERGAGRCH